MANASGGEMAIGSQNVSEFGQRLLNESAEDTLVADASRKRKCKSGLR